MFISVVLPIFASACSNYRAEVLGPLNQITDFGKFASDLQLLKSIGVKAMATDVWWGNVEVADQQFDWSYYDRLSNAIVSAGLQWIPIMRYRNLRLILALISVVALDKETQAPLAMFLVSI